MIVHAQNSIILYQHGRSGLFARFGRRGRTSGLPGANDNAFVYRRFGWHLLRRPGASERWEVAIDLDGTLAWARSSWLLNRKLTKRTSDANDIEHETVRDRMVRACVEKPDGGNSAGQLRARLRAGWLRWQLSPPLAFGGPRTVSIKAGQAAQDLARHELSSAGGTERIEREAKDGWEQGRARLTSIEERAMYFLGATGLGASVLIASSGLLIGSSSKLDSTGRVIAIIGLSCTICGLAGAGVYGLTATMMTFGRVSPDVTSRVVERAAEDNDVARLDRAARFIASRRRSSYIGTWKLARLRRAGIASGIAVGGLILMLVGILLSL